jgi:hypothetical protein
MSGAEDGHPVAMPGYPNKRSLSVFFGLALLAKSLFDTYLKSPDYYVLRFGQWHSGGVAGFVHWKDIRRAN